MDTTVNPDAIELTITDSVLSNTGEELGIVNNSYENEDIQISIGKTSATDVNEFTEVDLNDSVNSDSSSIGITSTEGLAKINTNSLVYRQSKTSCHCYPTPTGLQVDQTNPSGSSLTNLGEMACRCKDLEYTKVPIQSDAEICCRFPGSVYFEDFGHASSISDGVVLHFSTCSGPSLSKDSHLHEEIVCRSKHDPSQYAVCDCCTLPPPSYRSIIEKTIADPPPAYQTVTGIETNINEIAEDVSKKREQNSRNWNNLSLPKSRRLVIVMIFIITLIIGGILVILAVLK